MIIVKRPDAVPQIGCRPGYRIKHLPDRRKRVFQRFLQPAAVLRDRRRDQVDKVAPKLAGELRRRLEGDGKDVDDISGDLFGILAAQYGKDIRNRRGQLPDCRADLGADVKHVDYKLLDVVTVFVEIQSDAAG